MICPKYFLILGDQLPIAVKIFLTERESSFALISPPSKGYLHTLGVGIFE